MNKIAVSCVVFAALQPFYTLADDDPVDLGSIEIVEQSGDNQQDDTTEPVYSSYDPIDSGTTVIGEQSVNNVMPGGIDTTEILGTVPGVQLDNTKSVGSKENIQSLRPRDFSISGGNYYDNNVMVDGVSATSALNVTNSQIKDSSDSVTLNWYEVTTQTSQTLYVDPSLIGEVEVFDSNISAKYGDFLGGVVNYKIRQPKKEFGFKFSAGFQNDSMLSFHDRTSEDDDELGAPADFTKWQTSVAFDLPLTDKLSVLAAYTRAESSVSYQDENYFNNVDHDNGDKSENFLLKGVYEYSSDLTLEGQILYSPYSSEYDRPDRYNDHQVGYSTGLQGYLSAKGWTGNTSWDSKLSYNSSDTSRDADSNIYIAWRGSSVDWCNKTSNCLEGSTGDLQQQQQDYSWDFNALTPVFSGTLSYGSRFKYTFAESHRPEDATYYALAKSASGVDWQCSDDDPSCNAGSVTRRKYIYSAYDADIGVYSHALWTEYQQNILDSVSVRAGVNYSYDNFLNNHNIAPRFTTSWEFLPETYLTLGANRYFANNMLSYALRSKQPASVCYQRDVNTSDGSISDWESCSSQPSANGYRVGELDTPYSDELTAAITVPTPLAGNVRLQTVYRKNHKQFTKSDKLTDADDNDYYQLENGGGTDYLGYSIEWTGQYANHAFGLDATWSTTYTHGHTNYMSTDDDETEEVYYQGSVTTKSDMYKDDVRDNYAAPFVAKASWQASWFKKRLLTSTLVKYQSGYKTLEDTGDNIDIDGSTYDIWEFETTSPIITVDFNTQYRFLDYQKQQASIGLKVSNLFDYVPDDYAEDYVIGRSYWVNFSYEI
ncbi:Outer membrane receptor proteins, mostly Fe transport [Vibrio xiamenensis]|uniref:Outer membrane receptor proteins, mostly Fe transport n=1 Tax=Vibrio xiamenensis TaxID=861298 RepID=A0A1G8ET60_9VIBR|nr:TonB-dependent receptor plug domain-containing protein [Vibrio xiamenensis]SDH73050.1 Outer membrane receptor proteins, mostly Fe transport [Vibrio xiamenensis]